jgi:signal transduction histidine kinase
MSFESLGILDDISDPLLLVLEHPFRSIRGNKAFYRVGAWDPTCTSLEEVCPTVEAVRDSASLGHTTVHAMYHCRNLSQLPLTLIVQRLSPSGPSAGFLCTCSFDSDFELLDWRRLFFECMPNRVIGIEADCEHDDARLWFTNKVYSDFQRIGGGVCGADGKNFGDDLRMPLEERRWWTRHLAVMARDNIPALAVQKTVDRGGGCHYTVRTEVLLRISWGYFRTSHARMFQIRQVTRASTTAPPRFFLFSFDITELQRISDELAAERRKLQSLNEELSLLQRFFEQSPVVMGLVRLEGNELDFLQLLSNKRKDDPQNLTGRRASTFLPAAELHFWISKYLQSKQEGKMLQFEWQCSIPELHVGRWYSVCVSWFSDNRYLYLAKDITAEKTHAQQLEQAVLVRTKQLEEALQIKSRFLAVMSHEIRTPLAGIMGSIGLLDSSEGTNKQELLRILQGLLPFSASFFLLSLALSFFCFSLSVALSHLSLSLILLCYFRI